MLKEVPAGYDEMYKNWAKEGSRVLALGFKKLTRLLTANEVREASRDSVESNLQFAGFLVFHCPLKEDSVAAIEKLNASSHRVRLNNLISHSFLSQPFSFAFKDDHDYRRQRSNGMPCCQAGRHHQ
jgi:hypothetical protein